MQRPPVFRVSRSAAQVSGMTVLPQRVLRPRLQQQAPRNRVMVNSAVFHNASPNAHIEWRFP
jgi:hypothetical protein